MPDIRDTVKNFYEMVVNRKNTVFANSLISADFKDHNPFHGSDGTREGTKKFFLEYFVSFPDLKFTVDRMVAEGDMVVSHVTATGTNKGTFMGMAATGRKVKIMGMDMVRVANGQLAERWGVWDTMGMMTQLGLVPPPPGAPASK